MAVSLRKLFLLVAMVLALLAGMVGWTMRTMATPLSHPHHSVSISSSHLLADGPNRVTCPAPPDDC